MTTLTGRPTALSAMHHQHLALGAEMVESDGWMRPARYTSTEDELTRIEDGAGLIDVSPVGKIRVQGDEVEQSLVSAFDGYGGEPVGTSAVVSTNLQNLVIARLALDDYLIVTVPGQANQVRKNLALAGCGHAVDVTSALAGARIVGPSAARVLSGVTELDIDPAYFPDLSSAQAMVSEIHGTVIRRDIGSYLSYEIFFSRDFGEHMWESLMEAGEPYGLVPFGLETMAVVHEIAEGV
jgi:sarcosine oxidase subunit alpha